ncbi:MAG TPA: endopeptidase, partial [Thermoanaerobaculia bacterium]
LGPRTLTATSGGQIVQLNVQQAVAGVPVRGAFLSAVVNHGNLVLMGSRNWGAVAVSTTPALGRDAAVAAAESYVGRSFSDYWSAPHLELVPVSTADDPSAIPVGSGLGHRLVWAIGPHFADDHGTWEVLVDARSGEIVAFTDTNHYATKAVRGGVLPLSNDGHGVEGQEQAGYPMPFADVTTDAGELLFTDSGGDVSCSAAGTGIRTRLDGRYVRISDACGAIDEHAADPDDLDLGASAGTDCAVPPGSDSPGNTHSARTGFYEVNRIKEIARGWLPENEWLEAQITANMNIPETCNAFWNGSTINFYASGGGCRNTGEIAAVFDHEWGHGMDDNDANPSISAPGEAYADVASILRLNESCVGRGFDADDVPCGGNGDRCTVCTGVREVDWAKRASAQPHDLDWINSPTFVAPGGCVGGIFIPTQQGPCGQGTHCEGSVASEAVWDLFKRDLPAFAGAGFGIDDATAQELVTRLYYLGGGALGNWYNCNPVAPPGLRGDGCNADGAYLNFLAIDDDNGDLGDGTPHMPAVFAAFDRHQMACPTPAPVAAASCTRPTAAPDLTVTPSHKGAELSWAAVPGATKYWVFRGDGVLACSFG